MAEGRISSVLTTMAAEHRFKERAIFSKRQNDDDAHSGDTFWDSGNRLGKITCGATFYSNFAVNSFVELVEYIFTIPGVDYFTASGFAKTPLRSSLGVKGKGASHMKIPMYTSFAVTTRLLGYLC